MMPAWRGTLEFTQGSQHATTTVIESNIFSRNGNYLVTNDNRLFQIKNVVLQENDVVSFELTVAWGLPSAQVEVSVFQTSDISSNLHKRLSDQLEELSQSDITKLLDQTLRPDVPESIVTVGGANYQVEPYRHLENKLRGMIGNVGEIEDNLSIATRTMMDHVHLYELVQISTYVANMDMVYEDSLYKGHYYEEWYSTRNLYILHQMNPVGGIVYEYRDNSSERWASRYVFEHTGRISSTWRYRLNGHSLGTLSRCEFDPVTVEEDTWYITNNAVTIDDVYEYKPLWFHTVSVFEEPSVNDDTLLRGAHYNIATTDPVSKWTTRIVAIYDIDARYIFIGTKTGENTHGDVAIVDLQEMKVIRNDRPDDLYVDVNIVYYDAGIYAIYWFTQPSPDVVDDDDYLSVGFASPDGTDVYYEESTGRKFAVVHVEVRNDTSFFDFVLHRDIDIEDESTYPDSLWEQSESTDWGWQGSLDKRDYYNHRGNLTVMFEWFELEKFFRVKRPIYNVDKETHELTDPKMTLYKNPETGNYQLYAHTINGVEVVETTVAATRGIHRFVMVIDNNILKISIDGSEMFSIPSPVLRDEGFFYYGHEWQGSLKVINPMFNCKHYIAPISISDEKAMMYSLPSPKPFLPK